MRPMKYLLAIASVAALVGCGAEDGPCHESDSRCQGNTVEVCDAKGEWKSLADCGELSRLARGDVAEVVEGSVPRRPYFVEFPSYAAARACFHSASYQDAIALRAGAAEFDIVVVEGMPVGSTSALDVATKS